MPPIRKWPRSHGVECLLFRIQRARGVSNAAYLDARAADSAHRQVADAIPAPANRAENRLRQRNLATLVSRAGILTFLTILRFLYPTRKWARTRSGKSETFNCA